MKVAKVSFSVALLEHLLPLGSKVLSVRENEFNHTIEVFVEHDSFDEVPNGELPQSKTLTVYRSYCKEKDHSYVSKVAYAS